MVPDFFIFFVAYATLSLVSVGYGDNPYFVQSSWRVDVCINIVISVHVFIYQYAVILGAQQLINRKQ